MTQQEPIVVVSTGRCGSTLVSELLCRHPDVLSVFEFWPNRVNLQELFSDKSMSGEAFWNLLSVPMAPDIYKIALRGDISQVPKRSLHETNYMRRISLPKLVEDYDALFEEIRIFMVAQPEQNTGKHIIVLFDYLRKRLSKKVWVERTGANIDFLPMWRRMWPNMRIVHVYRDGRNCAISMSKHHAFRLHVKRLEKYEDASWLKIRPLDPKTLDIDEFCSEQMPLDRFGSLWNRMITEGMDEIEQIPEQQKLNLRFEDMLAEPEKQMQRLLKFINQDLDAEEWVKHYAPTISAPKTDWRNLDLSVQKSLTESCATGLSRLGYH